MKRRVLTTETILNFQHAYWEILEDLGLMPSGKGTSRKVRARHKTTGKIRDVFFSNLRKPNYGQETVRSNFRGSRREHPLYPTWRGIINRCYNEKVPNYKNYGGRGVTVFSLWQDSDDWDGFKWFCYYVETHLGAKPTPEHTIDKDMLKLGHYYPGFICWASKQEQTDHRRV